MNNLKKKKILIVTAFPTHGAGSGALITTQAKSYVEAGNEVVIITANNRTDFDKLEGVRYHIVPFTAEVESPEIIKGQVPFNYLMFTTHTESTANFWNVSLQEIEIYIEAFKSAIKDEVENFNPDIIHAQHNWITSSICNDFNKPVTLTIHGTDLIGYKKAVEELQKVQKEIANKKEQLKSLAYKNISDSVECIEEIYSRFSSGSEILRELKTAIKNKRIDNSNSELIQLLKLYDSKALYELYVTEARKSAEKAERIIVISDAQEKSFNELFRGNENKVKLIENGYDSKVFFQDKSVTREDIIQMLIPRKDFDYDNMVLFVGKFADFKGIDALLNSAKIYEEHAKGQGKKIVTIIVGSGVLEDKLKEQAQALDLKHTYFVGRKGHNEICKLQNLASVSLIPSRDEPFGLVVIEGTACGHPVIATNSGGITGILNVDKDILSDNSQSYVTKLGVLVPPLPDRPNNLDEQEKDKLDKITTLYSMLITDIKNPQLLLQKYNTLSLDDDILVSYLDQYMKTVSELSNYVINICEKNLEFNNDMIAQYTKETYSQEIIRDRLLETFDEAIQDFQNKDKKRNMNTYNKDDVLNFEF